MAHEKKGAGQGAFAPSCRILRKPRPRESASEVPVESLRAQPATSRGRAWRPRRLAELAASIRESGMVQPILVRRPGGRYQIIAGERRWRAAQQAGPGHRAGRRARRARRPAAGAGPGREHPARGADPAGGGPGLPAPAGGAAAHPGAGGAQGGQGALDGRQHPAPAAPAPRRCATLLADGRLDAGHARALLALERRRGPAGAGPRGRAAGPLRARGGAPGGAAAGARGRPARSGGTPTRGRPRSGCARPWGRGWRSAGAARGALRIAFASEAELNRLFELLVRASRGRA